MKTKEKQVEQAMKSDLLLESITLTQKIDEYIEHLLDQKTADEDYLSRRFENINNW